MQTRLIRSEEELLPLKDSWNALIKNRPENDVPFFSWDWFYHSWRHFGEPEGREPAVVVAEDGDRLLGVLPLVRGKRKSSGISYRTLEFCNIGMMPRNTAYVAPDAEPDAVFSALRDRLFLERKYWDILELANVLDTTPFHRFWLDPDSRKPSCSLIQTQGFLSTFIRLQEGATLDDYLATLGSSTRKDVRKHLRNFDNRGESGRVRFFESPEEIGEGLELLFEVHRNSWKGEYVNRHYPAFYRDVTPVLAERGEVSIAVAFLDGTPISAGYVLFNPTTCFTCINDYDTRYRDVAPGMVLFLRELEHVFRSGRTHYDFCGTIYEYKERLAGNKTNHSTFQIFHGGWKSRFLFSMKTKWLPLLRKILRKPQPNDLISIVNGYYRSVQKN